MQYNYLQPEYFLKFRCIGSECSLNCCSYSWNIGWFKQEYENLKNAPGMNEEVVSKIDKYFIPNPKNENYYMIKFDEDGRCPFHSKETGLCDIQKELGEEYLSEVCRNYPRSYLIIDGKLLRCCQTSCPAVVKLLMHDKKAVTMEEYPVRNFSFEHVHTENPAKFARIPYLQYRKAIIDFYSWLFTSRKTIETSLLLGALAAKNIADCTEKGMAANIPAALAFLRDSWKEKEPDIRTENIPVDHKFKYTWMHFLINGLKDMPFDTEVLSDGEKVDAAKYAEGKDKFYSAVTNPDIALNNIAMNIFLDLFTGLNLIDRTFLDFYIYFALCMTAVLYLGFTAGYVGNDTENDFIKAVCVLSRRIRHSSEISEKIFEYVERFSEPEQLAAVIR